MFFKLFKNKNKVVTRFAPSPTGELHIGGARTAFFAYLFAKQNKGKFLLRIEDTDRERYVEGSVGRIIEALKWLEIVPDNLNNFITQSERQNIYKKFALDLVDKGNAYFCTCSEEELKADREKQEKEGKPPRYLGHCRNKNLKLKDVEGGKYVVRMKMPESGDLVINDMIRGEVKFDLSLLDDQIILKSDGYPTYHLAAIVDDHEMGTTHVIRGEEWLPSTPKHIILYQMLGWKAPKFCHLPMILSPERGKLSKRHGATGVFEYKQLGYLPEAIINFIALLGWHPKEDREVLSFEEILKEFSLDRVQKAGAIFNVEKLDWLNAHYIKKLDNTRFKNLLGELFGKDLMENPLIDKLITLSRDRLTKLSDFKIINDLFFDIPDYQKTLLIWKNVSIGIMRENLKIIYNLLNSFKEGDFSKEYLEKSLMPIANERGRGEMLWPLRVALSGREKSPGPFEIMEVLEKKESLKRIEIAINKLND